jgi:Xaa-Pro aminopeptidase
VIETSAELNFPTLSLAERDRRWAILRALCDEHGLAGLVVVGTGRDQLDHYLVNESQRGTVVLPREGDPVYLVRSGNYPYGRFDAYGVAYERWVDEIRAGTSAPQVAAVLRELGLADQRLGVVGLTSTSVGEAAGTIPYTLWQQVLEELPEVTWVDVAREVERVTLVKSTEEIALLRKAAELGEATCAAFYGAVAPGVRESQVAAAALSTLIAGGGWTMMPTLLLRSGTEALGWTRPEWISMGGGSRRLQDGDVIGAELFSCYAGVESQQQIVVSVGEPDAEHAFLAEVARVSYDAGLAALHPGSTFAEVCDAMHAPLEHAGCWSMGPLVQTVAPVMFNSAMYVGVDGPGAPTDIEHHTTVPRDGDVAIEPGMAFAMEPNALRGKQRICVGGTVLVTEEGAEELNTLPTRLLVAKSS